MMKIAMVAGEANPFAKTGGLGDVVYALSKSLVEKGNDVTIIMPYYEHLWALKKDKPKEFKKLDVKLSWRIHVASFKRLIHEGITYIFVEDPYYFGRTGLYGYDDDGERFAFLAKAAVEYINSSRPKFDVVHCHDWHTGMVPLLLKRSIANAPKSVFTIHNAAFLGYMDKRALGDVYDLPDDLYDNGAVRFNDKVSTLKSGIIYADFVTTVSENFANELLTPEGGNGLEGVFAYRSCWFKGIVNGIDTVEFDPENDGSIAAKYGLGNIAEGKAACKKALLSKMGLSDTDGPVFGLVSRLTWQKGIELVFNEVEHIINAGGAICVLGSGESELENIFRSIKNRYPDKVGLTIGYDSDLAHMIYAGSDFFLMPSLFEPCGIGQMIALRYGTLPIVRETGGLKDTVVPYRGYEIGNADGFSFENYDNLGIDYAVTLALNVYSDKKVFEALRKNAMKADHTWGTSTDKYLSVYKIITKGKN